MNHQIVFPVSLKRGDKIAICSPAGKVDENVVYEAVKVLHGEGFEVEIMPHALGRNGNYSGTADERFSDLKAAFSDPAVRAILCSRGGYGVVHLMDRLMALPIENDPKWVIGFSDISAFHALMARKGIASIHASMCAHIKKGADDPDNRCLLDILSGDRPAYIFDAHKYDRQGIATGILRGGNLAVVAELINTPYDVFQPGSILFLEELSEPIYKVERIFYQLRLSGIFSKINGLIVGQFTEYHPSENYEDMETMIRDMVAGYQFPVAYNAPIGHVDHNVPMIESAKVTLKVSDSGRNSIIFHR